MRFGILLGEFILTILHYPGFTVAGVVLICRTYRGNVAFAEETGRSVNKGEIILKIAPGAIFITLIFITLGWFVSVQGEHISGKLTRLIPLA